MASIILGAAGAAMGSSIPVIGGVIGATLGQTLGNSIGGVIDNAIFGVPTRQVEGARLADLSVQVSTYGKTIPHLYGTMRLAGNIIWSTPIRETRTTTSQSSGGGKGVGGGGTKTTATTYSYTVSLAIALCAGVAEGIIRTWADAKLLDMSQGTYRFYRGTETQLPDPLIEAMEGMGNTPAYRGLCYVVIEDFPLADFGNRIPNFTFEVKRPLRLPDYGGQTTEEMITAMTLIPGAGEFVYDTLEQKKVQGEAAGIGFAQSAFKESINRHTPNTATNAVVALDQLKETCPNVQWVSVVVTWFGDTLDARTCTILPSVEYSDGAITEPNLWSVAGFTRATARPMTIVDGTPRYGGTPDDASVVRLVTELKARGYNVMFYPLFFMDVADKPWRGRVTGSAANVANFFTKPNGYNAFITHYANLMTGKVDAFVIGSELIGLTRVSASAGVYPAVSALVSLAATVRGIMGINTKLTYAADWSEYHHTDGGWYNLDPIWASANIDMIGIDAYFPLTNAPQKELGYGTAPVMDGWDSGEGYDYYYTDAGRTTTALLSPAYAWKNIDWFWKNTHTNPNGAVTAWIPQSKKIWFTEYGFPSVDGATNQPNVFYDPTSAESFFPRMSKGSVDFRAQRSGITGTEARWKDSPMIERMFLWTWDARPYPYFPDLRTIWADGGVWATGHWVTGKFGVSGLAAIVRDVCVQAGLAEARIDVSRLTEQVEGYVLTRRDSARRFLEELMAAYFFDCVESDGVLRFIPRGNAPAVTIQADDLVRAREGGETLSKTRLQEVELPKSVDVLHVEKIRNYQTGTRRATRQVTESRSVQTLSLPLVMSGAEAEAIASKHLYLQWLERLAYRFTLDDGYAAIEPTDVLELVEESATQTVRVVRTLRDQGKIQVEAVAEDVTLYAAGAVREAVQGVAVPVQTLPATRLALLDIPAFPSDGTGEAVLRVAACGEAIGWNGAALYRADDGGDYARVVDMGEAAVMGKVTLAPDAFSGGNVLDETSVLEVRLMGDGVLQSVTMQALLNGANAALVGGEVLQFREATELSPQKYRLRGLLRGRLGTEDAIAGHIAGEQFILLNQAVVALPVSHHLIGLSRNYKGVSIGATLGSAVAETFRCDGVSLMPYAPVHGRVEGAIGTDMVISWVRRDRLYGVWRDGVDAGLSEASEAYDVEVWVGGVLKRTLFVTTCNVTYTLAQQVIDGVSVGMIVQFRIFQLSALIGRGKQLMILGN
jgi:GTA TIM-barrel-like domain/Putative phage tail protein